MEAMDHRDLAAARGAAGGAFDEDEEQGLAKEFGEELGEFAAHVHRAADVVGKAPDAKREADPFQDASTSCPRLAP